MADEFPVTAAIVGTAKNTGKTTTLKALLQAAERSGLSIGLTSIGYDGEAIDNLTGLPKPRIPCPAGAWVATASECLYAGKARIACAARTGHSTPLGEIVLGRVEKEGSALLAGPNNEAALSEVIRALAERGVDLVLVDGALGRLAPASAVKGIVLATGAARNPSPLELAAETRAVERLFEIPTATPREREGSAKGYLLEPEGARKLAERTKSGGARRLAVRGAVDCGALETLADSLGESIRGMEISFPDAVKLLVPGRPRQIAGAIDRIERMGARIQVEKEILLFAVTVNPFYPRPVEGGLFEPRTLDPSVVLNAFRAGTRGPIYDVEKEGGEPLLSTVLSRCGVSLDAEP